MQDVNTRLNVHDAQIKDLQAEAAALSETLRLLGLRVEQIEAHVDHVPTAETPAPLPEMAEDTGETEQVAVPAPAIMPLTSEQLEEAVVASDEGDFGPTEQNVPDDRVPGESLPSPLPPPEPQAVPKPLAATVRTDHPPPSGNRNLEQKLSTNWLVWVGGVALALAGIFLVRYIAEQGWLSPATRCAIGVIFGFILIVAGEAIRRRPLERAIAAIRADYVPQALTAAGLVTAFGSVYLAYAFYDLLTAGWSFVLLAGIALTAFALSMVEGPFVAMLGLVGAILTPALVSTQDPSVWGFFTYLGVIAVASIAVADRRGWHWLPQSAVLAISGWAAIWINQAYADADIIPIGATFGVVALAGLTLAVRAEPRTSTRARALVIWHDPVAVAWLGLAAAAAVAFVLTVKSDFAPAAHWLVLCYAMAAIVIARFAPRFEMTLPIMAALSIAAFALAYVSETALANLTEKALGWPAPTQYDVAEYARFSLHAALIAVAFFAGGLLSLSRARQANLIAATSGAVPLILVLAGYAQFRNFSGDTVWALAASAVMIAATLATAFLRRGNVGQTTVQNIYAAIAVIAVFWAATFLLDRIWLTLAYAGLVLALALVSVRADLLILRRLVNLIVLIVLLRLSVNPDTRGYEILHPLGLQWVTYGYLVPIAVFIAASRIFRRAKDDLTVTVLEGAALLLSVVFISIEIRIFMTGSIYSGAYRLPEMSVQTIAWLTSALVLARRNLRYPRIFSAWGARLLTAAGAVQAVVLQLVLMNPIFTAELIQGYGLFNLLILSLLAPALLLWFIADSLTTDLRHGSLTSGLVPEGLRAASTLLAFAFITEEIRVLFQGMVISAQPASLLELYVTTLAWLVAAAIPYFLAHSSTVLTMQRMALAIILLGVAAAVFGHAWVYNPVMTGALVRGWPVFNTLLPGFFVPAAVLYLVSGRVPKQADQILVATCYFLTFVGLWLMIKHGFQGARLALYPDTLLELYITTLAWILLGALPFTVRRIGAQTGAAPAGYAVLSVSVLMLFAGHTFYFNPAIDGSYVPGWPVFNVLLLGFIVPSALLGLITGRLDPKARPWFQVAAYALLFIGVTMLVKQTFQGALLSIQTLTSVEDYGYSAAWLGLAIATMIAGIVRNSSYVRYASLAVLLLVVLKVFLLDMSGLAGLWRVASLFGLGVSLIGIGWVYQHFVYSQGKKARKSPPSGPEIKEA